MYNILKFLSGTTGVEGKFFSVKIIFVRGNFVLIFFLNFENVVQALYNFRLSFSFISHPLNNFTLQ